MVTVTYPQEIIEYVTAERAKHETLTMSTLEMIAADVRERWPKYPRFSAMSARSLGNRYSARKPKTDAVEPKKSGETCTLITAATYPERCGKPGHPWCKEHADKMLKGIGGSRYMMPHSRL